MEVLLSLSSENAVSEVGSVQCEASSYNNTAAERLFLCHLTFVIPVIGTL